MVCLMMKTQRGDLRPVFSSQHCVIQYERMESSCVTMQTGVTPDVYLVEVTHIQHSVTLWPSPPIRFPAAFEKNKTLVMLLVA